MLTTKRSLMIAACAAFTLGLQPAGADETTHEKFIDYEGCIAYNAQLQFAFASGFLNNVVLEKPITLIGDNNHANSYHYAFLAEENIIRDWAKNGVSDVYFEVNPAMHERIAPYVLEGDVDRDAIAREFENYFNERDLYTTGRWAEIRAGFLADFIQHATQYGIAFHFISDDPPIVLEQPELWDVYKTFTQIAGSYCSYDEVQQKQWAFIQSLNTETQESFHRFRIRLIQQRLQNDWKRVQLMNENYHGGRRVVLFGAGHFYSNPNRPLFDQNIRGLLGAESTTYIAQSIIKGLSHADPSADYTYGVVEDSATAHEERIFLPAPK